ncbi:MAG: RloB family protein [Fusobacterium perfoetens]|uniref:RloB family protein n=1 Tax=Fusobacterium perfoetens TaxID=852 RepID=UPI0023F540C7|nr:RloB family protein [Fusobacterium perfoetens]MCI6151965.1 RloB family protein [Fusobacterium perfoetens]MDY3237878.1 RloB family protein [Fusobacterium perfoetens]
MGRKSKKLPFKSNTYIVKDSHTCEKISTSTVSTRFSKNLDLRNIIKIYFNSLESEYNYFSEIKRILDKNEFINLKLEIEKAQSKGGKDPFSLVNYAIKSKENEKEIWVVFDKDDFNIEPAIKKAHENNIFVAFSNPCFELWFLNHFNYRETFISTDECIRLTKNILKTHHQINYTKNNNNIFELLNSKLKTGIKNSKRQHQEIQLDNKTPNSANPCSLIYLLIEKLKI